MKRFLRLITDSFLALLLITATLSDGRASAADDAPSTKKVALLVGVNRYDKPVFSQLNYSERDVDELATELKSLGFEVTVLKGSGKDDERATRENIRSALEQLVAPLGGDDVMLVMFSGHGQQIDAQRPDGNIHNDAFYCPVDAVSNKPETMVSLSYVIDDVLAPNVGRKLLLVDACRDAPKDPSRGSKGIQGKVIALPEDTAVLFSCRSGQQSWENDELQHGLFTYCVLEALQRQTDEDITWANVVAHVDQRMASAEMRARMGGPQAPIPAGGVAYTVLGRVGVIDAERKMNQRRQQEPAATDKELIALRVKLQAVEREVEAENRAIDIERSRVSKEKEALDSLSNKAADKVDYSKFDACPNGGRWSECDHTREKEDWLRQQLEPILGDAFIKRFDALDRDQESLRQRTEQLELKLADVQRLKDDIESMDRQLKNAKTVKQKVDK